MRSIMTMQKQKEADYYAKHTEAITEGNKES